VIDAVALYLLRGRGGELLEVQPVDGSLIKRVIDSQGRAPRPIPWDGRTPFDWCGLTITPENFYTQGFKYVKNGFALPPAYQQVLHGLPASDLTEHDLLYRAANLRSDKLYGVSPVEQILTTVNIAMRRTASQLEYYQSGNMPEALFSLPESWGPDMISRYQDYFDSLFVGNLANRRQMKFIAGGSKSSYIPIREPPLKSEFDEWLVRIVCFAFSYPPTPFLNLSNRSVAEQHDKTGEEEGLQDTKLFISDLINEVITEEVVPDGSIEFAWVEEDEVDQQVQSEILGNLVDKGILTRNQARQRLGEEPDPDPAANQLMVTTGTGVVPIGTTPNKVDDNGVS
jgi:Phage portal protein